MKKEYIIPVFVPHLGCPNDCVFCNQKSISGQKKNITKEDARKTIDYFLENIQDKEGEKEIAFFGGSFTGIDEKIQNELLELANEYIKKGQVSSIRISTRPDYINKEILIRWYGFNLGHQMMVGLPDSTRIDEINTAKALIKLKPKMVRIYPVLVIKGTKLEEEYKKGKYEPLPLVQAVEICKQLVRMFADKKIEVIRVGLQNTEEISEPGSNQSEVVAGPFHPAFRQLVESSMWYDAVVEKIKKLNVKVKEVEVTVNPIDANNVIGHKKENIKKLKDVYEVDLKVKQDANIKQGKSKIEITKKYNDFLDENK